MEMHSSAEVIANNLKRIRARIDAAASRAGRSGQDVQLVAVTKYVDAALTRRVAEAGCLELGESRPQQLWDKAESLGDLPVHWHLIGHLQRNKIRRTLGMRVLIHSGDRLALLRAIDAEVEQQGLPPQPILIEVNVSADSAKHGFRPLELPQAMDELQSLTHLQVRGLMAMGGRTSDAEEVRRQFASLRRLKDDLLTRVADPRHFDHLSMGMSGDFELAIEEGATLVRIGSAIFEGL